VTGALIAAGRTDIGRARRTNQDAFLLRPPIFAVADGLGGHQAGDVAARLAIRVVSDRVIELPGAPGPLADALIAANEAIWNKAGPDPALNGMATTCTLLALGDQEGFIAHVGDSRVYRLRAGRLVQLTTDHSLAGRLVREGHLSPEDARELKGAHTLSRALGSAVDVEVDVLSIDVRARDRYVLCSDGLTTEVGDGEIASLLADGPEATSAVERLIGAANAAGGRDNVTVLVVDIGQ